MVEKLLTTKHPLRVALRELSTQLGRRGATLRADWNPRLQNEEADALTSSDFRHFDAAKRIPVDLSDLKFKALNHLFDNGDTDLKELESLNAKIPKAAPSSLPTVPTRKRRRKAGDALRDRDPW